MKEGEKKAWRFVWEQRAKELKKAIEHWPMSIHLQARIKELNELTDRLKTKEKD